MRGRPLSVLCLLVVGILMIMAACGLPLTAEYPQTDAADAYAEKTMSVTLTGAVRQSEIQEDYSFILIGNAILYGEERNYKIHNVKVYLTTPKRYAVGSSLCLRGKLRRIKSPTNPGEFDRELYYRIMGVRYTMSDPRIAVTDANFNFPLEILAEIREKFRERVRDTYPEDVRGIISSMLIGDKSMLDERTKAMFRIGGVSHMLVISGLHVTLLAEGVYRILRRLRFPVRSNGRWRLTGIRDTACVLISMGMLVSYAGLTGLSVSTARAVIMYGLVLGARLTRRIYDLPTAMSVAVLLLLIENPMYLLYSGFQLSFLAVLGIHLVQGRGRLMSGVILALVTLPVVLRSFYEMPLFGTVINMIAIPCLPAILGFALLGLLPGGIFAYPAVLLTRGLLLLLNATASIPFSSIILGRPGRVQTALYVGVLALYLYLSGRAGTLGKRFAVSLLIPVMICVIGFHGHTGLAVHFLDVGQGDCIVIEGDDGTNIAVDGGSTSVSDVGIYRILPFLKSEGIRRLDYLVLTHMDEDHTCGMRQILQMIADRETSLRIDTVVLPYLADRDAMYLETVRLAGQAGARVLFVSAGDSFAKGNLGLTVLGPDPALETHPVDPNAQCVVLAVSYKEFDCLLTGDVVGPGEDHLTDILRRAGKQFDVLKVAHHGSKYSTPEEFLDIVWPEISIVSCGADNRYGHPHAALLKRLRGCGTRILRTDECGEIAVKTDGESVRVRTYADG